MSTPEAARHGKTSLRVEASPVDPGDDGGSGGPAGRVPAMRLVDAIRPTSQRHGTPVGVDTSWHTYLQRFHVLGVPAGTAGTGQAQSRPRGLGCGQHVLGTSGLRPGPAELGPSRPEQAYCKVWAALS